MSEPTLQTGSLLGEYRLVKPLGEGGMGVVWLAEHVASGLEIALKVMRSNMPAGLDLISFQREVEAVARCRHPNVVQILDFSVEDTPWLAMGFAGGGDLATHRPAAWDALKKVLEEILLGLAHTHARGIIHRDLKALNVLLDQNGGAILTDFGLAHPRFIHEKTAEHQLATAGTPYYMAPEQFTGAWRDYGPTTDLYALGCMAFELASGRPPFVAPSIVGIAQKHLNDPVPKLAARFSVPEDFEDWLNALLHKDPQRRTPTAAHALAGLRELGPASQSGAQQTWEHSALSETLDFTNAATLVFDHPTPAQPGTATKTFGLEISHKPPNRDNSVWRLESTGLSLFGLREVPNVGREEEHATLWHTLKTAQSDGLQFVQITGPPGSGKSKLATWLRRSAEAHAGCYSVAINVASADWLQQAIGGALNTHGLNPGRMKQRVQTVLSRIALDALIPEFLSILRINPTPEVSLSRAVQLCVKLLEGVSRGRTIVMHVQGLTAENPVTPILKTMAHQTLPACLVVTTQTPIESLPGATVALKMLDTDAIAHLIREHVHIDSALASRIAQLSGDPSTALQTVGSLIRSGVLKPSRVGYRADDVELEPFVMTDWKPTVFELFTDHMVALGCAAVLGQHVSRERWQRLLDAFGLGFDLPMLTKLSKRGLITTTQDGGVFQNEAFRRTVLNSLPVELRQEIELAAAETGTTETMSISDTISVSNHYLNAGKPQPAKTIAFEALKTNHQKHLATFGNEYSTLVKIVESAVSLGAGITDDEQLYLDLFRATDAKNIAGANKALALATDLQQAAGQNGNRELQLEALLVRTTALQQLGRLTDCIDLLSEGLTELKGVPGYDKIVRALASAYLRVGDIENAERFTSHAIGLMDPHTQASGIGWCYVRLSDVCMRRGEFRLASTHAQHAYDWFETSGFAPGRGEAINLMGEVLKLQGDYEGALELYARSARLLNEAGSFWVLTPRLNAALAAVLAGKSDVYTQEIQDILDEYRKRDWRMLEGVAWLTACGAAANQGNTTHFDRFAREAVKLLEPLENEEPDIELLVEHCRLRWAERGEDARAAILDSLV